jgi:hypothetical protein
VGDLITSSGDRRFQDRPAATPHEKLWRFPAIDTADIACEPCICPDGGYRLR